MVCPEFKKPKGPLKTGIGIDTNKEKKEHGLIHFLEGAQPLSGKTNLQILS